MPGSSQVARSSHALEEHTGELKLRIEAPSLPDLFAEAGKALAEAMGAPEGEGVPVEKRIEVEASDRDALLVDWLNELVFLAEAEKMIFREFRVELPSEGRLLALARGARVERLRNPVKAATYHALAITARPQGFVATVVLDV
ncbi:MAG TPA: archease [Anaeromyxobacteraceae bacterium]|nr:archease [Anaeromyxobacteraceae bacterium]